MEYTVSQLAKISGVSSRTLRYYDSIELLKPMRISSSGYRIYGKVQVDRLQQILFYRELDMSLDEIKEIIGSPDFNLKQALENHLIHLQEQQRRIDLLINNVNKTIISLEGEYKMDDREKFEGFKKDLVNKNEEKYGEEVRKMYGDAVIDDSNAKLMGMTKEQWEDQEVLNMQINEALKSAVEIGDPSSEIAQKACDLHRQWLCRFWKAGTYSKEAHKGLGQMYMADERYKAYYDNIADGAAKMLSEALEIYCR